MATSRRRTSSAAVASASPSCPAAGSSSASRRAGVVAARAAARAEPLPLLRGRVAEVRLPGGALQLLPAGWQRAGALAGRRVQGDLDPRLLAEPQQPLEGLGAGARAQRERRASNLAQLEVAGVLALLQRLDVAQQDVVLARGVGAGVGAATESQDLRGLVEHEGPHRVQLRGRGVLLRQRALHAGRRGALVRAQQLCLLLSR